MKCKSHPDKDSTGACNHCARNICPECLIQIKNDIYCKDCVAVKMLDQKKLAHSPALAAILSFIVSGMGQIYNGQIGKGILIFFTGWLIIPWIIGIFDAYSVAKKINEGKLEVNARPGCLIAAVIGVIVFFFTFFLFGLVAAIAIPNILRVRIHSYESFASEKVKNISEAVKNYRLANNGAYPLSEDALIKGDIPYLFESYNNKLIGGYIFKTTFNKNGYEITAYPKECGPTGTKIFTAKTGGIIYEAPCNQDSNKESSQNLDR